MPAHTTYPGVYIEERPSGAHAIVGVSTSTTAFVGAAAKGPVDSPVRIFNFADYVRSFGLPLDEAQPMGHAVQHYFVNGGSQAIVVRVVRTDAAAADATLTVDGTPGGTKVLMLTAKGKGTWANAGAGLGMEVSASQTGTANNSDLFNLTVTYRTLDPVSNAPVVSAQETYVNLSMSPKSPRNVLKVVGGSQLVVPSHPVSLGAGAVGTSVGSAAIDTSLKVKATNHVLRVSVDFGPAVDLVLFPTETADTDHNFVQVVKAINDALTAAKLEATASHSSGVVTIASKATSLDSAVTVTPAASGDISKDLKLGLAWGGVETSGSAAVRPATTATPVGFDHGSEGTTPVGPNDIAPGSSTGIHSLDSLMFPRFNLLCLPGVTSDDDAALGNAMAYCKGERAFLIVDSPAAGFAAIPPSLASLPALGEHGAIYYPRLLASQPLPGGASQSLNLPACGAVAGVIARTDASRGVWKAPAGRDAGIVGVSALTQPTDDNVSGLLNPRGINVLRGFPGAGNVIWGARTLKGDDTASSEFKYIPVRRTTDFIASSLYLGTQFAVFEPNDPDLWAQLRFAIGSFMRGLFRQGAFQQSPKRTESDSFFVICDETVNPQSEIDLGRVNVVVGFAPLKPAEFVVITITQITQLED